jgi:hypothetical protein
MSLRAIGGILLLSCAAGAPAWAEPTVSSEPPAPQRCLTAEPGKAGIPEYPFDQLKREEQGRVQAELVFTLPTARPEVIVISSQGSTAFVDAVKDHARHLRVPCLRPDEGPARLRLDFVFRPDDRKVVGSMPTTEEQRRRDAIVQCLVHNSGKKQPPYPFQALRQQIAGRVVAVLRFITADGPPEVHLHARPYAAVLRQSLEEWSQGYRMPCLQGEPVQVTVKFVFKFEGDREYGMRNITLLQFMGSVRDIRKQHVAFDTHTMSCPFDLHVAHYQPQSENIVGQLGDYNAARQPLIDWLRAAELGLPARQLDAVFADRFTLHVPCVRFDLQPKS